ncbi:MAG: hypothetical protein U0Q16_10920 [Bryobacteraceae bacterium]
MTNRKLFVRLGACAMMGLGLMTAMAQTASGRADADACKAMAGKTYLGYSSGKFDDYPDAASAMLLSVDGSGKGKARAFAGYDPKSGSATQQELSTSCTALPGGKTALKYTVGNGVDAGTSFITSYDNGERVWVESAMPGRPMKGWLLQRPAAPSGR